MIITSPSAGRRVDGASKHGYRAARSVVEVVARAATGALEQMTNTNINETTIVAGNPLHFHSSILSFKHERRSRRGQPRGRRPPIEPVMLWAPGESAATQQA
jgi:hypothetical protein